MNEVVFAIENLVVAYRARHALLGTGDPFRAVDGVSVALRAGETVAIVGESGCGKTSVARACVRLLRPDAGAIRYRGTDVAQLPENALTEFRNAVQLVFQDPFASLNPKLTVGSQVEEAARRRHGRPEAFAETAALFAAVGLPAGMYSRFPHELSGGQRQRIAIARALATQPEVLVCDEPTSALDVSLQAQVANLLRTLQQERSLALLWIAHDLRLVRRVSDRVVVLYLGRVVEEGPTHEVFRSPRHWYTKALLAAVPRMDAPGLPVAPSGEKPDPRRPPDGCAFHPRCTAAQDRCRRESPPLVDADNDAQRSFACWFPVL